jgi:hypothetical protein
MDGVTAGIDGVVSGRRGGRELHCGSSWCNLRRLRTESGGVDAEAALMVRNGARGSCGGRFVDKLSDASDPVWRKIYQRQRVSAYLLSAGRVNSIHLRSTRLEDTSDS